MDIVIGWGIVALYLIVLYVTMGSDYVWLIGMLIGWAEARELFGEQWVGAFGLTVALTVALVGWGTKLTRWIRHSSITTADSIALSPRHPRELTDTAHRAAIRGSEG